jgi:hypothetical protein
VGPSGLQDLALRANGRVSGEPGVAALSYLGEHLDLHAEDQVCEVERLIGLGATEVQWDKKPVDADYVILADPAGNLVLRDRYLPLT